MVMAEKLILTFYNSNLLTSPKSNMLKSWPLKINTVLLLRYSDSLFCTLEKLRRVVDGF